jgi:hypothetical protein
MSGRDKVAVHFNLDRRDGSRPDEHPSFQFYVDSLGDVPIVGDYVGMPTWSKEFNGFSRKLVRVSARRVTLSEPERGEERYDPAKAVGMFVTLMVEIAADAPDFRP